MILVELFQENNKFGDFWGHDWSLTEYVEAPESRREHYFDFPPPIELRHEWILIRIVNSPDRI